ncbi:MAG: dihydrofolate reductase [Alistipes sp.]|nr:dihydrofolate reductase [Alistipes sp.]
MLTIIVAVAENGVIGSENQLLWHIREDMVHFRTTTQGHTVAMGRKTFESIGRPLPKRRNIVITRQPISIEGCDVVHSLEEVLALAAEEDIFIIGGSQIYEQALPYADRLCLTTVHKAYEGDASFPQWNRSEWELISSQRYERGEEFEYPFTIEEYRRK